MNCAVCQVSLVNAKRRCKGLCSKCYDRKRKLEFGDQYKLNRRSGNPKQFWNQDNYLGLEPAITDWTRLAAFIDGEGAIGLNPRKTANSPVFCARVQVTNTNLKLVTWLKATFGMEFYSSNRKSDRWKDCYWAAAHGYRACWLLRGCLPWLLLKKEQAELVLEHQESIGSFERGSGVTTPGNIIDFRLALKNRLHDLNRRGPVKVTAESDVEKVV